MLSASATARLRQYSYLCISKARIEHLGERLDLDSVTTEEFANNKNVFLAPCRHHTPLHNRQIVLLLLRYLLQGLREH
jgi:hypothetical protein